MEDDYWHDESMRDQALTFVKNNPSVTAPLSLDVALRQASLGVL